jgi:CDP-diacylglycerol--glycerol-3-phosphate 3-phosphatidyltransferase
VYWITFAVAHVVPLWMPLIIVTRSFVVDAVRSLALARGKTAFGEESMARSSLTRFLTGSRVMRTVYGVAKLAAFVLLGALIATRGTLTGQSLALLEASGLACAAVAVLLCVVRGLPVIADAAAYLQPETEGSAA